MLSKNFRLKKGQVQFLMKQEKVETDLFIVKSKESGEERSRFAVVVSKKIFPKAVQRNHLKRQIHESIRLNIDLIKSKKDILLIPKKHIVNLKYREIYKGVQEMLKSM
ncbi:MAG: ribonuclease P protein component [Patescibacteria group bacterium]|nr:ribonuclease P protein component [Patescibacteria group bacterium]